MEPKVTIIPGIPEVPASTRIDSDTRQDYPGGHFHREILGKEIPAIPGTPERVVVEMDRATAIALRDVCGLIGGPVKSRRGLFDRLASALWKAGIPNAAATSGRNVGLPVDVAARSEHHSASIYFTL
jgi:hypothetical protein